MRRKGETLTEFLTAATVFGLMMAGIFEFIANHTETLADIRDKDELMYHAQRFAAVSRDISGTTGVTRDKKEGVSFDFANDKKTLTVSNSRSYLTFSLKP